MTACQFSGPVVQEEAFSIGTQSGRSEDAAPDELPVTPHEVGIVDTIRRAGYLPVHCVHPDIFIGRSCQEEESIEKLQISMS